MSVNSKFVNLITSLVFLIVIVLYYFDRLDEKILIAAIGSIATLYFGIMKYSMEYDKVFKELFQNFNERYDDKFNDLINDLRENDRELRDGEKNVIIDYLNLCAEEYLWYKRNRIPTNVWEAWKAGILENLKVNKVGEVYLNEISTIYGPKSFYGLVEELNISTV